MFKLARIFIESDTDDSDMISIKDAALALGCDMALVSRLMSSGALPEYRPVKRFEANVQRFTSRKSVIAYSKKKESRAQPVTA